jgi:hypothetical protein
MSEVPPITDVTDVTDDSIFTTTENGTGFDGGFVVPDWTSRTNGSDVVDDGGDGVEDMSVALGISVLLVFGLSIVICCLLCKGLGS